MEDVDWICPAFREVLAVGLFEPEEAAGGGELSRGVRGADLELEAAVGLVAR